ncbi:hypothetical protein [Haloplanus salinarum]|uniref:hypothetical protein n=1 Tax=Haloplanus salinarum TaxID=1912324 RepID=UPI00214CF992|nr:hypothetical protein [Haloplanus salinarum]
MQAYHTLVAGDSGGGKTTYLREAHATYPGLSIWIDHHGVDGIGGRSLDDAETVRSEREARQSDATRLRWRCDDPLDAARGARAVAHDYHESTGFPTQVIADEAQDGMLADGDVEADNPIKRMLHEDRDKALKVQVATQDPQDLEYTPLKQCKYWVWVGEWSTFHRGFINYFDLPQSELPTEPYQVVVFDKRMNVLHRTETKEVYA